MNGDVHRQSTRSPRRAIHFRPLTVGSMTIRNGAADGGESLEYRFCPDNCPGEPLQASVPVGQDAELSAERLVGVAGFEPATPSSRTWCATRLRYTPLRRARFSCRNRSLHELPISGRSL
jgi:hypothetical protein